MTAISSVAKVGWNYFKRGLNVYGPTVFGTGQEAMANAFKFSTKNPFKGQFYKDVFTWTKKAGLAAEKEAAKAAAKGGFWKNAWKSIGSIPKKVAQGWRVGGQIAAKKGTSKFLGKLGGALKGIGKKMPVIGSLLIVAFELPNIIRATKDNGIVAGLAEAAKAGARLGGATLLGALGTALGGPIGGIVGFMVGDWLAGKIVGKSYSEQKAEQEEKVAQQVLQQYGITPENVSQIPQENVPQIAQNPTFNPNIYNNPYFMNPYNDGYDDFLFNQTFPKLNLQA